MGGRGEREGPGLLFGGGHPADATQPSISRAHV